jgi:hypothetical protein
MCAFLHIAVWLIPSFLVVTFHCGDVRSVDPLHVRTLFGLCIPQNIQTLKGCVTSRLHSLDELQFDPLFAGANFMLPFSKTGTLAHMCIQFTKKAERFVICCAIFFAYCASQRASPTQRQSREC